MSAPSSPFRSTLSPTKSNTIRTSPFRRAESPLPASPSTIRATTPTHSSPFKRSGTSSTSLDKAGTAPESPRPLSAAGGRARSPFSPAPQEGNDTPPSLFGTPTRKANHDPPALGSPAPLRPTSSRVQTEPIPSPATVRPNRDRPTHDLPTPHPVPASSSPSRPTIAARSISTDPTSHIPAPLLHSIRESFAVLDVSNNGSISASDVKAQLESLGLDSGHSVLRSYFPDANAPINLGSYISLVSAQLGELDASDDLLEAFAAFDKDDVGVLDAAELKDCLLHAPLEPRERRMGEREIDAVLEAFKGRKGLSKNRGLGAGERFRYQEFVSGVWGKGGGEEGQAAGAGW